MTTSASCSMLRRRRLAAVLCASALLLALLALEPPARWQARVAAALRDAQAQRCRRVAPAARSVEPPSASPRLLLCMPVGPPSPARSANTERAIAEYLSYTRFAVTVAVDAGSPATAAALAARFPAAITSGALRLRVWDAAELAAREWPLATGWLTGEPVRYLLSHAHRLHMHLNATAHDWFAYAEDDMLIPEAALALAAERSGELWRRGWLPGFVREERNAAGAAASPDISSRDAAALRAYTLGGRAYAQVGNAYAAAWLLSRAQLAAFVAEPSGVWHEGPLAYDVRARMAWGYTQAQAPSGSWLPRALLPLDGQRRAVDARARILHLSNNYCLEQAVGCLALEALDAACQRAAAVPLPMHDALPCAVAAAAGEASSGWAAAL